MNQLYIQIQQIVSSLNWYIAAARPLTSSVFSNQLELLVSKLLMLGPPTTGNLTFAQQVNFAIKIAGDLQIKLPGNLYMVMAAVGDDDPPTKGPGKTPPTKGPGKTPPTKGPGIVVPPDDYGGRGLRPTEPGLPTVQPIPPKPPEVPVRVGGPQKVPGATGGPITYPTEGTPTFNPEPPVVKPTPPSPTSPIVELPPKVTFPSDSPVVTIRPVAPPDTTLPPRPGAPTGPTFGGSGGIYGGGGTYGPAPLPPEVIDVVPKPPSVGGPNSGPGKYPGPEAPPPPSEPTGGSLPKPPRPPSVTGVSDQPKIGFGGGKKPPPTKPPGTGGGPNLGPPKTPVKTVPTGPPKVPGFPGGPPIKTPPGGITQTIIPLPPPIVNVITPVIEAIPGPVKVVGGWGIRIVGTIGVVLIPFHQEGGTAQGTTGGVGVDCFASTLKNVLGYTDSQAEEVSKAIRDLIRDNTEASMAELTGLLEEIIDAMIALGITKCPFQNSNEGCGPIVAIVCQALMALYDYRMETCARLKKGYVDEASKLQDVMKICDKEFGELLAIWLSNKVFCNDNPTTDCCIDNKALKKVIDQCNAARSCMVKALESLQELIGKLCLYMEQVIPQIEAELKKMKDCADEYMKVLKNASDLKNRLKLTPCVSSEEE